MVHAFSGLSAQAHAADAAQQFGPPPATGGELGQLDRVAVAATAGGTSALISSPAELIMIQQQRTGESLGSAARRVVSAYGVRGLYRGFVSPSTDPLLCTHAFAVHMPHGGAGHLQQN